MAICPDASTASSSGRAAKWARTRTSNSEINPLAPQARACAVAPAERAFGDDHCVNRVDTVVAPKHARHFAERGPREHRLDRAVSRRELPPSPRTEQPRALLEQQRAAFLVVDAARRARLEEHRAGPARTRARLGVAPYLVEHRADRIFFRQQAAGGHQDRRVADRRERSERRRGDDAERKPQPADLFAHARQQRARVRVVAGDQRRRCNPRRLGEPGGTHGRRGRGDWARGAIAVAGEERDFAGAGARAGQRGLDRQLAQARREQRPERRRAALAEAALGGVDGPPQVGVLPGSVLPARGGTPVGGELLRETCAFAVGLGGSQRGEYLHPLRRLDDDAANRLGDAVAVVSGSRDVCKNHGISPEHRSARARLRWGHRTRYASMPRRARARRPAIR